MTKDAIGKALNLATVDPLQVAMSALSAETVPAEMMMQELPEMPAIPEDEGSEQNIKVDYNFSRENLYKVLHRSMHAFEGVCKLAHNSEGSRPYEVMALLMKTITETNNALIELNERKSKTELAMKKASEELAKTVNNDDMFMGSAADILGKVRG
jgi:hypothetical protein